MRLFKELQEAKDAQSTEVKLLSSLEKKVVNLELRHQHRETLINQVRYHRSDSSGTTAVLCVLCLMRPIRCQVCGSSNVKYLST